MRVPRPAAITMAARGAAYDLAPPSRYKAEPDPEAWIIANGRLFVFQFKDRVPMFQKIIDEVAAKANENWPAAEEK